MCSSDLELTAIERHRSFTDLTRFPLARMYDIHELEETPEGLTIRNSVRVEGPLSWLWAIRTTSCAGNGSGGTWGGAKAATGPGAAGEGAGLVVVGACATLEPAAGAAKD